MPWKDVNLMSLREEFVLLARVPEANVSEICRRFGISRSTGYKWIGRYGQEGYRGLADRSRRPQTCPHQTNEATEQVLVALRREHPAWGGRKLKRILENRGLLRPPAPSTITAILHRHGLVGVGESEKRGAMQRFEHETPNALWQMDFKGDFSLSRGGRCHPLSIIDDHSRFAVCLRACADQRTPTVQEALRVVFRRFGLPQRMLMDNGSCWGTERMSRWTRFSAWLIRLGVGVSHGRPYHPQTQGKCERFNRTLKEELIRRHDWGELRDCQERFDQWREVYNVVRPHEALEMATPMTRYAPSVRAFPETLPPVEYDSSDTVRSVHTDGSVHFRGLRLGVGSAFVGQPVAIRPTREDGVYDVYYCWQNVRRIDLRNGTPYKRPEKTRN